ncbi:MAG TPA: hypothetical protein VF498_11950 [Anaerolineales bacterium]
MTLLIKLAALFLSTILVVVDLILSRRTQQPPRLARIALTILAVAFLLFTGFLWVNHIRFPLNLEVMETVVWQHFQRAASFQPIYPLPTPAFVPLAYNPFYYVFSIPFSWIFGVNLFTLRLVSILGYLGSVIILYLVIREKTNSIWWGLVGAGLFAAAYRVMDSYLDTAHADSWLLFSTLLGCYLIDRGRSKITSFFGVFTLIVAFWFKQHGAVFLIGGLLFLTWRDGLVGSLLYWAEALALGPLLYLIGGRPIFGPRFIYFTWQVPRQWSEIEFGTIRRFIGFILRSYPFLAFIASISIGWAALRRSKLNIWQVQFVFAILTGLMGSLDPGSANNVFIPMGTWFILMGVIGLHELSGRIPAIEKYNLTSFALLASISLFLYNPLTVIVSPKASQSYQDLIQLLNSLPGKVYAPSIGQLPADYSFYPAADWVALEDVIRGPDRDTSNNANTRELLAPALKPDGDAYILANFPLDIYPWIAFLQEDYVLITDFGDRFKPLDTLPRRFPGGWPRYLYQYKPGLANEP